jgi:adenylate cyclase
MSILFSESEQHNSELNNLRQENTKLLNHIEYLTNQIREQNGEIRDYMKREREQRRQIQQQQHTLEERNLELERQQDILAEQSRQIEVANVELETKNLDLASEKAKSEALLLNILPHSIMTRLQKGETVIADYFTDVTVIFADIVGFTDISTKHEPETIVQILNWVFSIFDGLTERFGLEKIKTIGDAYMVASGIPKSRPDHAQAATLMALAMVREIQDLARQTAIPLRVRVGMHTGPVVAGVIGRKKFIYDLWGDTVNTASRMESHGEANMVHCTETVAQMIMSHFAVQQRGTTYIKGKGDMTTYFVTGIIQQ